MPYLLTGELTMARRSTFHIRHFRLFDSIFVIELKNSSILAIMFYR
jgi:hypothetical protein